MGRNDDDTIGAPYHCDMCGKWVGEVGSVVLCKSCDRKLASLGKLFRDTT